LRPSECVDVRAVLCDVGELGDITFNQFGFMLRPEGMLAEFRRCLLLAFSRESASARPDQYLLEQGGQQLLPCFGLPTSAREPDDAS